MFIILYFLYHINLIQKKPYPMTYIGSRSNIQAARCELMINLHYMIKGGKQEAHWGLLVSVFLIVSRKFSQEYFTEGPLYCEAP